MGEKIQFKDNQLLVPDFPVIPYIEGDGIGAEIWEATQTVVDKAIKKAYGETRKIEWKEVLAGQKAFDATGSWLPDETLAALDQYRVSIKGPLTTPVGGGIRSLNVTLRQKLDLYVCLRPVRYFTGVPSPVKRPEQVDMVIFRENTEDIYAGIEFMAGDDNTNKLRDFMVKELGVDKVRFPETSSFAIKPISKEGTERLVRAAIKHAIRHNLPSVTLVHKGNIMKFTEGAYKRWGFELAEREFKNQVFTTDEFERIKESKGFDAAIAHYEQAKMNGKVIIKDFIMDAFLQETILRPDEFSVIATMNLNGDYASDQVAALVGGIGIAPGGNINYKEGYALFEATHGTAPSIAGMGKANPSSLILSANLLLDHIGWTEAADLIIGALEKTIQAKYVTSDLYSLMDDAHLLSTKEFGEKLISNL